MKTVRNVPQYDCRMLWNCHWGSLWVMLGFFVLFCFVLFLILFSFEFSLDFGPSYFFKIRSRHQTLSRQARKVVHNGNICVLFKPTHPERSKWVTSSPIFLSECWEVHSRLIAVLQHRLCIQHHNVFLNAWALLEKGELLKPAILKQLHSDWSSSLLLKLYLRRNCLPWLLSWCVSFLPSTSSTLEL